ncbi:MAG TPA: lycopene cyclase domain-containing protein [Nannocystaceae bacterium]|nr:lycopene cyclase domain-containing protein [Nannocystaceae bacterium]
MRWEYAAFDLAIGLPPALASRRMPGFMRPAVVAILVGAAPFVVWDIAVAGRHWDFNPEYVLGPRILGLPVEEWAFFFAVPCACLLLWESLLATSAPKATERARWIYLLTVAAGVLAMWAGASGRSYTALALCAVAGAALVDHALGVRLLQRRAGWAYVGAVVLLTTACNGYLTSRPIVVYDLQYQLGWLVGSIPIEDYGFGLALLTTVAVIYEHARGRAVRPSWAASWIRRRFGGYRHVLVAADRHGALAPRGRPRVAIVGGGLAGLTAAELLSRRGFEIVLFEREHRLGGKLAGWRERLDDGFDAPIEHGFHAFFRHYYNLREWLDELGLGARLKPIDDYAILDADGRRFGFASAAAAPGLNLIALARSGMFRLRDVLRPRTGRALETLLRYDADREQPALDHTSFAEFAAAARLPPALRMVFSTFARAFFADERRISMAELVAAFHFYYLGHDLGLLYDWLDGAYDEALIDPIAKTLTRRGVEIRVARGVERIASDGRGLSVDDEVFERVVVAADVGAARAIIERSDSLAGTQLASAMAHMHAGQRYVVMRIWCARRFGDELPLFVVTDRRRLLDAIAFVDRSDPRAGVWACERNGSVIELHCYAVPDDLERDDLAALLLADAEHFLPGVGMSVVHRHVQVRADFTALHVGMRAHRPTVETDVPGLLLAGDWVRLPCPAKLMEAAHLSARLAVDAICRSYAIRGVQCWTVPRTGLLAANDAAHPELYKL